MCFAELYEVETKNLKRAVRANIERFPDDFMFELTKEEYNSLRCKNFTIKNGRGQHSKYLPFAFTREGIAMLSGNDTLADQNDILLAQHYQNCNPKNLANVSAVLLVSLYLMRRRSDFLISFKCFF